MSISPPSISHNCRELPILVASLPLFCLCKYRLHHLLHTRLRPSQIPNQILHIWHHTLKHSLLTRITLGILHYALFLSDRDETRDDETGWLLPAQDPSHPFPIGQLLKNLKRLPHTIYRPVKLLQRGSTLGEEEPQGKAHPFRKSFHSYPS